MTFILATLEAYVLPRFRSRRAKRNVNVPQHPVSAAAAGGNTRYQFIYAQDLAEACVRLLRYDCSDVLNIGSDNVKAMREVYQYVIDKAAVRAYRHFRRAR